MKVWRVNFKDGLHELDCSWTSKEKAINYFYEVANECGWSYGLSSEISEKALNSDNEDYLVFICSYKEEVFATVVQIEFLDEKPFWG